MYSMSTKNVPQVMHGGDRCNCGIDYESAINGALVNKLCTTKPLRSRSGL